MWSGMQEFLKRDPDVHSADINVLLQKTLTDNFAHFVDKTVLQPELKNNSKIIVTNRVAAVFYTILLQEGSYLKEPFSAMYV